MDFNFPFLENLNFASFQNGVLNKLEPKLRLTEN
jgi:hypothetical protein